MAYTYAQLVDEVMRIRMKQARGETLTDQARRTLIFYKQEGMCPACGIRK